MESAILPCLISSWEELDSSMVELLMFIQASITLGGNDINQAPWIKKRTITESYCKIGKKMAYLFFFLFLYSVNNFRIFRIPELFTE